MAANNNFYFYCIAAIMGRFLIKVFLPELASVEPIIPIAIIAGIMMGGEKGAGVGIIGYLGSNFLLVSVGDWVFPQMIGGAIAGLLPAYLWNEKDKTTSLVIMALVGTIVYELIINLWYGGLGLEYFLGSTSFGFIHIISNVFIILLLAGFVKGKEAEKDGSEEKEGEKEQEKPEKKE